LDPAQSAPREVMEFQNEPNVAVFVEHKPGRNGTMRSTGTGKVSVIKQILLTRVAPIGLLRKLTDFTNKMMLGSFRLLSLLIAINLIREG
jgi:hypothetical protein